MRKKLALADIEWDEHGQPRSREFGDVYFYCAKEGNSEHSGLEESRYVFLQQNQLQQRWETLLSAEPNSSSDSFVIGETGFGTGLNFLAAWELWHKTVIEAQPDTNKYLHFISVEKHPLRYDDLKRALLLWPELSSFADQFLNNYPKILAPGYYNLQFPDSNISLSLLFSDAVEGLQQCLQSLHPNFRLPFGRGVDAWFLDGFSPRCNPEMWNQSLFETITALSHDQTSLSTFTAVGDVQRLLKSTGFNVKKVSGFAHKREMLTASFSGENNRVVSLSSSSHSSPHPLPWSAHSALNTATQHDDKTIFIVGAGLAGCHTARELAEKGWRVQLLDRDNDVAMGASGNPHGIVYAKLSVDDDALAQFNLNALLIAEQCYQHWWQQDSNIGSSCGILQLAHNDKEQRWWERCKAYFFQEEIANSSALFLDSHKASAIAGVKLPFNACYFPRLGWINPQRLCKKLIDHPLITLSPQTAVSDLKYNGQVWNAYNHQGNIVASAQSAVIANAGNALTFEQTSQLPLKNIRGQISYFNNNANLPQLKTVVCGEAYITPTTSDETNQSFGASFNLHHHDLKLRVEDHQSNLNNLKKILPDQKSFLDSVEPSQIHGRSGYRCTTPDYLPIVGPIHSHSQFIEDYALLKLNANAGIHTSGRYWPNLYINVGHGSRGLAYTPLSARLLSSQINNDPLPVSQALAEALNPGRFTIRGLIRRQL